MSSAPSTSSAASAIQASALSDAIAGSAGPLLVDFWAPWCAPCRALAPRLDAIADRYAGQLQVRKLNIDEAPEMLAAHDVRGIPTLILFKDGQVHSRRVGLHRESELDAWVRSAL